MIIAAHRLRAHGHTLFSKPRMRTRDAERAERSMFIYASDADTWGPEREGWYSTSLMGIVNGFVKWTGFRFAFVVTKPDANHGVYILRTELRWFGWPR